MCIFSCAADGTFRNSHVSSIIHERAYQHLLNDDIISDVCPQGTPKLECHKKYTNALPYMYLRISIYFFKHVNYREAAAAASARRSLAAMLLTSMKLLKGGFALRCCNAYFFHYSNEWEVSKEEAKQVELTVWCANSFIMIPPQHQRIALFVSIMGSSAAECKSLKASKGSHFSKVVLGVAFPRGNKQKGNGEELRRKVAKNYGKWRWGILAKKVSSVIEEPLRT